MKDKHCAASHYGEKCGARDATEILRVGRDQERVEAWLALSELCPHNYTYGGEASM